MKALDRAVERFCYKHPRFGIPNLMLYIIIGNAAAFLLGFLDTTGTLYSLLAFSPAAILKGRVWQLITFLFIPRFYSLWSAVISLYFYYIIGTTLQQVWGQARFSIYYGTAVLFSIFYGFAVYFLGGHPEYELDGYYINMSLFFAYATLFPDHTVYLFFFIPIKMKWLALADGVLFIYLIFTSGSLYPLVAIATYLLFCGYRLFDRLFGARSRAAGQAQVRQAFRRAQFKSSVRQASVREKAKPFRHQCAVCGKTDTDYPDLEFRYCSRCVGYHCFCIDHINNHIHFTE